MSTSLDRQSDAQLQKAIAQADAALDAVRRIDAAVAGADLAAVVQGLEGIKQRAHAQLQDLQRQREAEEAAGRKRAHEEAKVTSRRSGSDKQAQVEAISAELNTTLRLSRVDGAVKELLAFLEDEEFYAANATTARKRRLRSLQNAIGKALA